MSAIELRSVSVNAGGIPVLQDVSLSVAEGDIVAIVGHNGAGKTTLLDVVSGTVVARGSVSVFGTPPARARADVGRVYQASPLPQTLTVEEVAGLIARRRDVGALLQRFGLETHGSSFVAELSTGMRRILDLALALSWSPRLLLLDEPSSGLARAEVERLGTIVRTWRDDGGTVLVVEHDMVLVRALADEVVVLEAGVISGRGPASDLAAATTRSHRGGPVDGGLVKMFAAIGDATRR